MLKTERGCKKKVFRQINEVQMKKGGNKKGVHVQRRVRELIGKVNDHQKGQSDPNLKVI